MLRLAAFLRLKVWPCRACARKHAGFTPHGKLCAFRASVRFEETLNEFLSERDKAETPEVFSR
jgi:hypothetical protein